MPSLELGFNFDFSFSFSFIYSSDISYLDNPLVSLIKNAIMINDAKMTPANSQNTPAYPKGDFTSVGKNWVIITFKVQKHSPVKAYPYSMMVSETKTEYMGEIVPPNPILKIISKYGTNES